MDSKTTLTALAVLTLTTAAAAGDLQERWRPEKPDMARLHPGLDRSRIVVKLRDGAGARVAGRRLGGNTLDADVAAAVARIGWTDFPVQRLISLDDEQLASMRAEGQANTGRELADLTQLFLIHVPEGVDSRSLIEELNDLAAVELAYAAQLPAPPPGDITPTTPALAGNQSHLAAAPVGVGAALANAAGTPAAGVRIADIEYSWNLRRIDTAGYPNVSRTHEDLSALDVQTPKPIIGGAANWVAPFGDDNHGTAVLGILAADQDGVGMDPVAPGAEIRVMAAQTSTGGYNVAFGILRALLELQPGDVLLIEQQSFGPNYIAGHPTNAQFGLVPVEQNLAEYLAIRQATALHVHVIEPAGNGQQDLDSGAGGVPGTSTGDPSYTLLYDPNVRDSGALMVSAATSNVPHQRLWYTNFGRRSNAYSFGENINTLAYGDLWFYNACPPASCWDRDQYYTNTFGGTSGASAIVAGCAAVLQGHHAKVGSGRVFEPAALRMLLDTVGTASFNGASDRIGRQPALGEQMQIAAMGKNPAHVVSGTPSSQAGAAVAPAGDVDGDGTDDIAVGAPNAAGGAGRVYVMSGRTGETLFTLGASAPLGANFGAALVSMGDLDLDGRNELAVGAPNDSQNGPGAGAVYVFDGLFGQASFLFFGAPGDLLGWSLANVGDIDFDNRSDLAAGTPGRAVGGGGFDVLSVVSQQTIRSVFGSNIGAALGTSMATVGDLTFDMIPEIVVGEPLGGIAGSGAAYIYDVTNGGLAAPMMVGTQAGEALGSSVAGGLDLDFDTVPDVIVGSPFFDKAGAQSVGRVQVFSGFTGQKLHQLAGAAAFDEFGCSVAVLGDVNGDPFSEFLVGAPKNDAAGSDAGAVYLFDGLTKGYAPKIFTGQSPGDLFGSAVAAAGDLDRNRIPDVLVGAPNALAPSTASGRGYTFLSPLDVPLQTGAATKP
jgi:hypothetical protein